MRKSTLAGLALGAYCGWRGARSGLAQGVIVAKRQPEARSSVPLSADKVRAIVDLGKERMLDLVSQALGRNAA